MEVDASRAAANELALRLPPRPFRAFDCPPTAFIFLAAFTSLSNPAPQLKHSQARIPRCFLPPRSPQLEQV
jgi:hypothetical protein